MNTVVLEGCTTRPLGSYLKALAVLRLVSEQADAQARGWWHGERFHLRSTLSEEALMEFFLERYRPTPILAPWNGGSGFYPKDRKVGIDAIAGTSGERFRDYRESIAFLRGLPEVREGKSARDEEERRTAILRQARNQLCDAAVEWLDATVGIASDGRRAFAPILGTGGNEGRLDYTNNFMERLAGLLINAEPAPARELLRNALFGSATSALEPAAVGQYDPGRAGGANQSQGIESPDVPVNPWDFVLTFEGAVAWASGIYRRQGVAYSSFLCSPFTVRPSTVGYGSSSAGDDARAELWTPLWSRPARYAELKVLLREGRAAVGVRPAANGIEFAESASSLGVDRGIDGFVRYSLLKRRGDSYVALPAGTFAVGYRSYSDHIRKLEAALESVDRTPPAPSAAGLRRAVDAAVYAALLRGGREHFLLAVAAFGRLLGWYARTGNAVYLAADWAPEEWLDACGAGEEVEVRIAAALSSFERPWPVRDNLFADRKEFAWNGLTLAARMTATLERRIRAEAGAAVHPLRARYELHPGDATLFIEGSTDDGRIENLLYAFTCLDWKNWRGGWPRGGAEVMPAYAALKHLFLPSPVMVEGEEKRLAPDGRVLSLLRGGRLGEACQIAVTRLRVAGLNPLDATYGVAADPARVAGALLIPARRGPLDVILHKREQVQA